MAACAHVWHYKCISRLLHQDYPMFQCPNCRAFTDLSAEVDDSNDVVENEEAKGPTEATSTNDSAEVPAGRSLHRLRRLQVLRGSSPRHWNRTQKNRTLSPTLRTYTCRTITMKHSGLESTWRMATARTSQLRTLVTTTWLAVPPSASLGSNPPNLSTSLRLDNHTFERIHQVAQRHPMTTL